MGRIGRLITSRPRIFPAIRTKPRRISRVKLK
jgi:hypothetical protein